jgi:hypothetical protein
MAVAHRKRDSPNPGLTLDGDERRSSEREQYFGRASDVSDVAESLLGGAFLMMPFSSEGDNYGSAEPPSSPDVAEAVGEIARGLNALRIGGADIEELRQASGLTWKQLSNLFGVGVASLQHWASGAPIGERDRYVLSSLLLRVRKMDGDATLRRAQLLAPGSNGLSIYDNLRRELYDGVDLSPDHSWPTDGEGA